MKTKLIIASFVLLSVAVAACWAYWALAQGPVYQGKSVSQWFGEIQRPGPWGRISDPAIEALVTMGDEAVPYLMRQYAHQDSSLRKWLTALLQRIPWLKLRPMPQAVRQQQAYHCLKLIGPRARRAIPELLRWAQEPESPRRNGAIALLGHIHSDPELVVPVLMRFLENTDVTNLVKISASLSLGRYGTNALAAAPILRGMLTNEELPYTKMCAATALIGMGDSIDLALPIISLNLQNTHGSRHTQVSLLGEFAEAAKPTVPLLIEALKDRDANFMLMVMTALTKIDPDAAIEAGLQLHEEETSDDLFERFKIFP